MAKKSKSSSSKGETKVHKVMKEHKEGTLKSGSGKKVKSRKQARARFAPARLGSLRQDSEEEKVLVRFVNR